MTPRHPHKRRTRIVAAVALAAAGVLLASTATNLILERVERSRITPYGDQVEVTGGTLNVYRNDRPGPSIVLLSGLGTAAPALDFAPLIRELGDYDVTVIEGFGYGYSDLTAGPRTVENISAEIHDVVTQLDLDAPYTLVGHSIAGFYTLHYANAYPDEVSAVIGIDPTVPAGKANTAAAPTGGVNWMRALSTSGAVRAASSLMPALAEPAGEAFTPSERERIRLMASWNFGNAALSDETARISGNAEELIGVAYPDDLPVLTFLAEESITSIPDWREMHENQLENVTRHEIVELAGGHYLHWTQAPAMATKITEFLGRR